MPAVPGMPGVPGAPLPEAPGREGIGAPFTETSILPFWLWLPLDAVDPGFDEDELELDEDGPVELLGNEGIEDDDEELVLGIDGVDDEDDGLGSDCDELGEELGIDGIELLELLELDVDSQAASNRLSDAAVTIARSGALVSCAVRAA